jgi:outer membrane protein OmpA-like peptidoglycan-associated protein
MKGMAGKMPPSLFNLGTDMNSNRVFTIVASCAILVATFNAQSAASDNNSYAVVQPKGTWQTPGEIQEPTGPWREPGDIQVPKGIQAVKSEDKRCLHRISVVADALFDFNKSDLRADVAETLNAAGPEIAKAGKHKVTVEGHTDSIGTDAYNDRLSEARAETVRDWLAAHNFIPADSAIKGYGKKWPVASNTTPDGKDDPVGRQKNRRVEIAVNTCD